MKDKIISLNSKNTDQKRSALKQLVKDIEGIDPEKLKSLYISWDQDRQFISGVIGVDFGLLGFITSQVSRYSEYLLMENDNGSEPYVS